MWELATIAVAFLVVSAGVAALARSTTARWERERRVARRRAAAAPSEPSSGIFARLGRARVGAVALTRPAAAPLRILRRAASPILAASQLGAARGTRSARRVGAALRHAVAGNGQPAGEGSGAVARSPRRPRRAHLRPRVLRGGLLGHGRGPGTPRRTRRLAARIGHREGTEQAPQGLDEHRGPAA
jgi:hypothetical protein